MVRYSFPVRLFHSLLHAGLSRRSRISTFHFLHRDKKWKMETRPLYQGLNAGMCSALPIP